jgi:hypothetical protein
MTDIFISYKREDEARVAPIVDGLKGAGLSVWWDREIPGGGPWRQSISEQLAAARCVIVAWSEISVSPLGEFVQDEAGRAKARGVLIPVRIDQISEPLGFGEVQSLDLVDWHGNVRDLRFQNLVAAVKAVVAGRPRPRPMTPGRRARLLTAWVSGLGVAATVLGFATNLVGLQKPLCKIPGVHAVCASWGLGGVPTTAEEILWTQRVPGDCKVLQTYLDRFPKGAYAEEASRRLQAAVPVEEVNWVPEEHTLPLAVGTSDDPLTNEQAARTDALTRGRTLADQTCGEFKTGGYFRLKLATVEPSHWRCFMRGTGYVCRFEGQATCHLEVGHVTQHQVCK